MSRPHVSLAVEILQFIERNPRSSPIFIARTLLRMPGLIRNHLVVLSQLELVETPARGMYLVTDLGREVLRNIIG